MDLKDLVSASEKLGLTGDALRKWVEEEQARAREERAAERDARREQAEREERALVLAREKAALDEKILLLRLRLTEAEADPSTGNLVETQDGVLELAQQFFLYAKPPPSPYSFPFVKTYEQVDICDSPLIRSSLQP
ncbi:hypothetical protein HPB52_005318 [Rhipicephalus sanguineus]|uniref:Uncharacterized protein n=1 Tax=Rhipicephalus sanguineus TaxID=34632 RepID=A0A9D4SXQ2_RHISA|nr:hypothetical protein HPB52_005318 [Rhipicephalus sanguineus]